jgi:GTPase SAR1 family protein
MDSEKRDGGTQGEVVAHKLVILGDVAVGKSSIAQRFVNGKFIALHEPTIGKINKIYPRCIIFNKKNNNRWLSNKIRNMGYCRPRKIPCTYSYVLS